MCVSVFFDLYLILTRMKLGLYQKSGANSKISVLPVCQVDIRFQNKNPDKT